MSNPLSAKRVFAFVSSEIVRHQNEIQNGTWHGWSELDILSFVPDPHGGIQVIGRDAARKLSQFAAQTISARPELVGRLRPDHLVTLLKRELGKSIYEPCHDATQIVEKCVEEAKLKVLGDFSFFIPCLLPKHSKIKRFSVGPICFHRKEDWARSLSALGEREANDFERYARDKQIFNWIAEVRISGFAKNLAEDRAYLFTRMAIAGIKMGFDDRTAAWIGTDQHQLPKRVNYTISQTGKKPQVSKRIQFIHHQTDDAVEHLLDAARQSWMRALGSFIDHYMAIGDFGFLGNRIITALTWFDTASSPISDAEKVIAYTNCLEALFVTEDRAKKEQIKKRASPLLSAVNGEVNWTDKIGNLYSVRSELVHGEISPFSPKVPAQVEFGFRISSLSIQAMLYFCIWLLTRYPVNGTPKHLSPFNGRGSFSKAFDHIDEFIRETFGADLS